MWSDVLCLGRNPIRFSSKMLWVLRKFCNRMLITELFLQLKRD